MFVSVLPLLKGLKVQVFYPLASPLKYVGEPGHNTIKVNVTVQIICRAVDHTLVVCFGQRKMGSDEECDFSGGVSLREVGVQPGVPHTFTANESVYTLPLIWTTVLLHSLLTRGCRG